MHGRDIFSDMRTTFLLPLIAACSLHAQRITVPLDGAWSIEDSVAAAPMPERFTHTGPVPGMANLATPSFPDVDRFDSIEGIRNLVRFNRLSESDLQYKNGISRQQRNYFWYQRTFRPSARREVAILKVNKAQFGTAVWVNGKPAGEHSGCFTAGYFNITELIRWDAENTLVVRVGAHPAVLPPSVPSGTDQEKTKWTPGIYDSVSLILADNPVIESVQVAPRITGEITVETKLRNYSSAAKSAAVGHSVAGAVASRTVSVPAGGEQTIRQVVRIARPHLWTPEDPFLYKMETAVGVKKSDTVSTRFGVREFRFDTTTRRAYLNGKPYFLRGSNITLHRFFEDPKCGRLPWDKQWVRKLLAEIPKQFHWNSFRFCIGPVPDYWLEVADEAGLLIQNEFFVWQYHDDWDTGEMVRQYSEWMRDNWNHPSVAWWDADNETRNSRLGEIISKVRGLDLSNRQWDDGYNLPGGADDPIEDHPYLFSGVGKRFKPVDLETMTGAKSTNSPHPSGHATVLNEYGWLWLNRDGTPTELTKNVYAYLVGEDATPKQRFEANAYYLGGLTEFWRAHRNFAGVLHFVYLTASFPGGYTADHFEDAEQLRLEPNFADYMRHAFNPLGVYINFWQPKIPKAASRRVAVMMVNDRNEVAGGRLTLAWESESGETAARKEQVFEVAALGQTSYLIEVEVPARPGAYVLKATADDGRHPPTVSRRKAAVE